MRARFPAARVRVRNRTLLAELQVRPTALSRTYAISVAYRTKGSPSVRVVDPDLTALPPPGWALPHVYSRSHPVALCLYLPGAGEWSPMSLVADTLIPWAIEWLFYFEAWLVDGNWRGGGQHPGDDLSTEATVLTYTFPDDDHG